MKPFIARPTPTMSETISTGLSDSAFRELLDRAAAHQERSGISFRDRLAGLAIDDAIRMETAIRMQAAETRHADRRVLKRLQALPGFRWAPGIIGTAQLGAERQPTGRIRRRRRRARGDDGKANDECT